ncbi:hypothetical protein [Chryseobacterium angstadtii]|uniref:hypothetical protein n=1 Tax=Chryseobacterium angstadtii TaxID=558151 RepID=UPI000B182404|nr:hypothetical protein [Chryseobacterium angstadtii]
MNTKIMLYWMRPRVLNENKKVGQGEVKRVKWQMKNCNLYSIGTGFNPFTKNNTFHPALAQT